MQRIEAFVLLLEQHYLKSTSFSAPEDVFLAGYPKSGNTWLQHLLFGLHFGADMRFVPDKMVQLLFPDVQASKLYLRQGKTTIFKTHQLPEPGMQRVIKIVRDGRDCMASYFAMNRSFKLQPTWEQMIVEGKSLNPCKWSDYMSRWRENPFQAEILWVRYEDLLAEPIAQAKRHCAFLNLDRPDSLIEQAVHSTGFAQMRAKELEHGWFNSAWDRNEAFIRKGKIGSYKEEIPPEYVAVFEHEAAEHLRYFGYISPD